MPATVLKRATWGVDVAMGLEPIAQALLVCCPGESMVKGQADGAGAHCVGPVSADTATGALKQVWG